MSDKQKIAKSGSGNWTWFPYAVSVVSLVFSGAALWITSLSTPNISAVVGSLTLLGKVPAQMLPGQKESHPLQVTLKLACDFSNLGARSGTLDDIVLELKGEKDGFRALFFPEVIVDDEKYFEAKRLNQPDMYWVKTTFSPDCVIGTAVSC